MEFPKRFCFFFPALLLLASSLAPAGCYVVPASESGVGSPCRLPTGRRGVCKLITECPVALAAVRHGTRRGTHGILTRCGFRGNEEIVCCEGDGRGSEGGRGNRRTVSPRPHALPGSGRPQPDTEWLGRPSSSVSTMQTLSQRKSEIACRTYASRTPKTVSLYITGGTVAKKGEFPHMAVLGYPSTEDGISVSWDCGGTLISDRYVMTAAHCLSKRRPNVVRLGELDLTTEADGAAHVDYSIEEVHTHPSYDSKSIYHDIALIRLNQTVPFTEFICPACLYAGGVARSGGVGRGGGDSNDLSERILPDGEEIGPRMNDVADLRGKSLIVSGWGRTEFIGDKSAVLLKADLQPYTSESCSRNLTLASGRSTDNLMPRGLKPTFMMCAGDPVGNQDTCLGDSGGPIQFQTKDFPLYTVVGITSFGDKCGYSLPAIYTRVSYYLDWIEGIVWRGSPPF